MTGLARRILLALPIMAAATALSALLIGVVDGRHGDLGYLTGLQFVLAVSPLLYAISRRCRLKVELPVAASLGLLISLSFPALLVGDVCLNAFLFSALRAAGVRSPDLAFVPAMMIMSALGARFVAAALRKMTGRHDRYLRWAMVVWGACWPLFTLLILPRLWNSDAFHWWFPRHHQLLGPTSILAWQIPIGLACVIWFLRSARHENCRAPA